MNPQVIVSPVDLSSGDSTVVARAIALARWHGAQLHVVYVRPGRGPVSADDALHARVADFVASHDQGGAAVTAAVLSGEPVDAVAEYARARSADLVIVGQHGRRRSRFWSSGTFATALGRAVECPAVMLPTAAPTAELDPLFRNIVCGIDFSPASFGALTQALRLAQESGGRVTLVSVLAGFPYETVYSGSRAFGLLDDYRSRIREVTQELYSLVPPEALNWCDVDAEVTSGVPHDAILATASDRAADLIVIGHPRRPRVERIATRSAVGGIHRGAHVPVLTVPGPSGLVRGRLETAVFAEGEAEALSMAPV